MNAHDIRDTDRETLSALFDGELQGDARRFASRRLSHDTAWQEDCGRWQLIGDAMRRQAPIAAPAGFAARVERAIAAEATTTPAVVAPVVATSTRRPLRMWVGGALAASLALIAVVATRSPTPVAPASQPQVAAAASPVASPAVAAVASAPVVEPPVAAVEAVSRPAAAPVQRVATAQRTPPRTVARAERRDVPAPAAPIPARDTRTVLAASTFSPPDAANPFHVPAADPLATRPWPRAALAADAALTASYGAQGEKRGESPSFYPFEPRTPADAPTRVEAP